MDPIHPITPRPPAIPAVAPARSDRAAGDRQEQRRQAVDRDGRRREREREHEYRGPGGQHADASVPGEDEGPDAPRHIDVRA